jgi:response regulator of citrate/malate metabolism
MEYKSNKMQKLSFEAISLIKALYITSKGEWSADYIASFAGCSLSSARWYINLYRTEHPTLVVNFKTPTVGRPKTYPTAE